MPKPSAAQRTPAQARETGASPLERYLGSTIRELRRKHGLTIADISDRTGISRGMLSRIETGHTATSLDTTLRFRIAFAGEAGYVARNNTVADEAARCSFIIRPPGDSLTAHFKSNTEYRYCSLSLNQEYLRTTLGLSSDEMPAALLSHWERKETVMGHFPASKAALAEAARFFSEPGIF